MPPTVHYRQQPPPNTLASIRNLTTRQTPAYGFALPFHRMCFVLVLLLVIGNLVFAILNRFSTTNIILIITFVFLLICYSSLLYSTTVFPRFWENQILNVQNSGHLRGVVVNLGCGTGRVAVSLLEASRASGMVQDLTIVGLDNFSWSYSIPNSPRRLLENYLSTGAAVDQLIVHTPSNAKTPQGQAWSYASLPFADNSINLLIGSQLLAKNDDIKIVAAEHARILQPGGRIVLCPDSFRAGHRMLPYIAYFTDLGWLARHRKDAGSVVMEVFKPTDLERGQY